MIQEIYIVRRGIDKWEWIGNRRRHFHFLLTIRLYLVKRWDSNLLAIKAIRTNKIITWKMTILEATPTFNNCIKKDKVNWNIIMIWNFNFWVWHNESKFIVIKFCKRNRKIKEPIMQLLVPEYNYITKGTYIHK